MEEEMHETEDFLFLLSPLQLPFLMKLKPSIDARLLFLPSQSTRQSKYSFPGLHQIRCKTKIAGDDTAGLVIFLLRRRSCHGLFATQQKEEEGRKVLKFFNFK